MLCRARPRAQATPSVAPYGISPEPFWIAPATAEDSVYRPYGVFISHAEAQRDLALWLRDHLGVYGYRTFVGNWRCVLPSHAVRVLHLGTRKGRLIVVLNLG